MSNRFRKYCVGLSTSSGGQRGLSRDQLMSALGGCLHMGKLFCGCMQVHAFAYVCVYTCACVCCVRTHVRACEAATALGWGRGCERGC